ncbi:MAG: CDP-alcohol phosphatidyltransferase family protein [Alphaproteobacteria bacterium]|nr:CDP-alcohol phosphatidyltransferase family protein [Alphaproteobacteria bacterium]
MALRTVLAPPNLLCIARLLATPVIVWLILTGRMESALAVFVIAGITDAIDGPLARWLNQVSDFGRIIDPIADKALVIATFISLFIMSYLPMWLAVLVLGRDLAIVAAFFVSYFRGIKIRPAPAMSSKVNTTFQITLAALVLVEAVITYDLSYLVLLMIYATAASTIVSWAHYGLLWVRTEGTMQGTGKDRAEPLHQKRAGE